MVRGLAKAVRGSSKAVKKEKEEYEEGSASSREGSFGPRTFPHDVKEACWAKAETVKGRDPARWRRDALGNVVFRKLVGCQGCLCHDFDHIVPYSKGGPSTLDNCQILQAPANRAKGARMNVSKTELQQRSAYCSLSGREMDFVELSAYNNVHHIKDDEGGIGCRMQ